MAAFVFVKVTDGAAETITVAWPHPTKPTFWRLDSRVPADVFDAALGMRPSAGRLGDWSWTALDLGQAVTDAILAGIRRGSRTPEKLAEARRKAHAAIDQAHAELVDRPVDEMRPNDILDDFML